MEEEILSTVSNSGAFAAPEGSDANSSSNLDRPNKRQRDEHSTSSASRFKGVVMQQNGNWGAQIYANHQRIWLGTFKTEQAAAMAYDSAAIKLRKGYSHRNFPWTDIAAQEPFFQDLHTTDKILNMIKDGSYQSKLMEFIMNQSSQLGNPLSIKGGANERGILRQELFHKELTPSDVGKLNRLVIPKKYAVAYFPLAPEATFEENEDGGKVEAMELTVRDSELKLWKFRYCYWKSSQSFVFTRGWNRFVKEKELKAGDTVVFYMCQYTEASKEVRSFCMIETQSIGGARDRGQIMDGESSERSLDGDGEGHGRVEKGIRLFGVEISKRNRER
uniref:AP2/ERF and B3 domain-containing transcription factor At1g50680-like n=1 Tax=Nelumbo nucifera TaxID=4432 RepID=A0A822ZWS1_NELNU|nr:TPA_asm: hypothetical protein HUJ06_017626 [Nelumbo nucifera]